MSVRPQRVPTAGYYLYSPLACFLSDQMMYASQLWPKRTKTGQSVVIYEIAGILVS